MSKVPKIQTKQSKAQKNDAFFRFGAVFWASIALLALLNSCTPVYAANSSSTEKKKDMSGLVPMLIIGGAAFLWARHGMFKDQEGGQDV